MLTAAMPKKGQTVVAYPQTIMLIHNWELICDLLRCSVLHSDTVTRNTLFDREAFCPCEWFVRSPKAARPFLAPPSVWEKS